MVLFFVYVNKKETIKRKESMKLSIAQKRFSQNSARLSANPVNLGCGLLRKMKF